MNLINAAKSVAEAWHGKQMYGDMPYIYHLNAVAQSVASYGDDYVVVGYLHDILEDTKASDAYLRSKFSDEIVDAVVAMTKMEGEEYGDYIKKVVDNDIAYVVKMYDSMCNLQESLKTQQWRRVLKYSNQLAMLARYK